MHHKFKKKSGFARLYQQSCPLTSICMQAMLEILAFSIYNADKDWSFVFGTINRCDYWWKICLLRQKVLGVMKVLVFYWRVSKELSQQSNNYLSSLVSTRFNKRNKNIKVIILNEKKSLGAIDFKLKWSGNSCSSYIYVCVCVCWKTYSLYMLCLRILIQTEYLVKKKQEKRSWFYLLQQKTNLDSPSLSTTLTFCSLLTSNITCWACTLQLSLPCSS